MSEAAARTPAARRIVRLRTRLRPGDLGTIVQLHGVIYAREYGFDTSFEAYVAGPLAAFAERAAPRERLWLAETAGRVVGCVGIVKAAPRTSQIRWFLVDPSARGRGVGRRLLRSALQFSRRHGYTQVILWTVRGLDAAVHLYEEAGFVLVRSARVRRWGTTVVDEKYALRLRTTRRPVRP